MYIVSMKYFNSFRGQYWNQRTEPLVEIPALIEILFYSIYFFIEFVMRCCCGISSFQTKSMHSTACNITGNCVLNLEASVLLINSSDLSSHLSTSVLPVVLLRMYESFWVEFLHLNIAGWRLCAKPARHWRRRRRGQGHPGGHLRAHQQGPLQAGLRSCHTGIVSYWSKMRDMREGEENEMSSWSEEMRTKPLADVSFSFEAFIVLSITHEALLI